MKENRKIRYTKRVIRESIIELLRKKDLSKITVKELCEVADINRSTFYSHYQDLYDLIEKMEKRIIRSVMKNIDLERITKQHQLEVLENVFVELKLNRHEFELVYLNPTSARCFNRIFDKIYEYSTLHLKNSFPVLTENQIKHIYGFISRGCAQMVNSWMEGGMVEEPKVMARLMRDTLKGRFYY